MDYSFLEDIVISLTGDAVRNVEAYYHKLKLKARNQTKVVLFHAGNYAAQQANISKMKFNGT